MQWKCNTVMGINPYIKQTEQSYTGITGIVSQAGDAREENNSGDKETTKQKKNPIDTSRG